MLLAWLVLIPLIGGLLCWQSDRLGNRPPRWIALISMSVVLLICLDLWALGLFTRHRTSALPFRPASAFVVRGPYRFTRNPMYAGLVLQLAGIGLALGRTWILLAAGLAILVLDRHAIAREERYLERRFGATYLAYKSRVRRWL